MRLWELEEGDEGPGGQGNAHFVGARGAEAAEAHLAAAEAIQADEFAALAVHEPAQVRDLRDRLNDVAARLGRLEARYEGQQAEVEVLIGRGEPRRGARR